MFGLFKSKEEKLEQDRQRLDQRVGEMTQSALSGLGFIPSDFSIDRLSSSDQEWIIKQVDDCFQNTWVEFTERAAANDWQSVLSFFADRVHAEKYASHTVDARCRELFTTGLITTVTGNLGGASGTIERVEAAAMFKAGRAGMTWALGYHKQPRIEGE